jgi:putative ABC transport system permease protein
MIWNYLKLALRNISKNKVNSAINILGLSIGFSVSILMMVYVHHQLSFDNFHENADRIYRLTLQGSLSDGKVIEATLTGGDVGPLLQDNVAEIAHVTRLYEWNGREITLDERRFTNDNIVYADSTFFRIFSFNMLKGNPFTALSESNSVVLTKTIAEKYFGDEDAMNKTIKVNGYDYLVTGVMDDFPVNSHMKYDLVASFYSLVRPDWNIIERNGISFPTYIMTHKDVNYDVFAQKTIRLADEKMNERFGPHGITVAHAIQPMNKIYLFSNFNFDNSERGDIRNVYIFSFLAFFIILIAVFNFVNLYTAQSEKRMREIGLRKVVGASRTDLIRQFIGESVIIALLAFVFSLMLNELFIGGFGRLLDEQLTLSYWKNPVMLIAVIAFVFIVGVISGIYPAFYLSRFMPAKVMKGTRNGSGKPNPLRKLLVTLQFAITVFLIISVILLHFQISYMKTKELGFDRENVVTVEKITQKIRSSFQSLKAELLQNPNIITVAGSQSVPGINRSLQNCYRQGDDPRNAIMIHENRVLHDYVNTFGITITEGRDFDPKMSTDTASVLLNQQAVQKLGLTDPIGAKVVVWQFPCTVIGVMADYNFLSLHEEIDPLALTMYEKWFNRISVRMRPDNITETMDFIRERFKEVDPNYTFEYVFVDESFTKMYDKESRVNNMITSAAVLAIIISILGLYALTSFTLARKVKEIGIRKAMGASEGNIIMLLFGDLSRWITVGNLIAWPLAIWAITRWMQNFAFRISLLDYWWVFVTGGFVALLVGALTIIVQALKAARTNPVQALRYE